MSCSDRTILWGAWGERYFLKSRGMLSPRENFELTRLERGGFCCTLGVIPVHTVVSGIIPAVCGAWGGLSSTITGLLPVVAAMFCVLITPTAKQVRKAGSVGAAARRKQLKVYLSSFALCAAAYIATNEINSNRQASEPVHPAHVAIQFNAHSSIAP